MGIRLIVADTHLPMREAICSLLAPLDDLEIVAVADGGECAVRLAEQYRPDLLILGVGLSLRDGIDAVSRIAGLDIGVKVLVLGTYIARSTINALLVAGARGYLVSDMASERLAEAIRKLVVGAA